MTNEEIVFMAQKAGGYIADLPKGDAWLFNDDQQLERFAALVAAREREACVKLCEEGWKEGFGAKYQGDVFAEAIRARG